VKARLLGLEGAARQPAARRFTRRPAEGRPATQPAETLRCKEAAGRAGRR